MFDFKYVSHYYILKIKSYIMQFLKFIIYEQLKKKKNWLTNNCVYNI